MKEIATTIEEACYISDEIYQNTELRALLKNQETYKTCSNAKERWSEIADAIISEKYEEELEIIKSNSPAPEAITDAIIEKLYHEFEGYAIDDRFVSTLLRDCAAVIEEGFPEALVLKFIDEYGLWEGYSCRSDGKTLADVISDIEEELKEFSLQKVISHYTPKPNSY